MNCHITRSRAHSVTWKSRITRFSSSAKGPHRLLSLSITRGKKKKDEVDTKLWDSEELKVIVQISARRRPPHPEREGRAVRNTRPREITPQLHNCEGSLSRRTHGQWKGKGAYYHTSESLTLGRDSGPLMCKGRPPPIWM